MEAKNLGKIDIYQGVPAENHKRLIEKSREVLNLLRPSCRANSLAFDLSGD